ncbi:MAG: hypothetical protein GY715_09075 [Planctomycetes bacterium]|nr:hypothetical protein [Planctomycetota bacterium]
MFARTISTNWKLLVPAAALLCGVATAADREYVAEGLGTLGGEQNAALAMNDIGMIVGWCDAIGDTGNIEQHAFLWEAGVMSDLGTLNGAWSEARAINNWRQIVGVSRLHTGEHRAMYWRDGVMYDLNSRIIGLFQNPDPDPAAIIGWRRFPVDKTRPAPPSGISTALRPKSPGGTACYAPLVSMLEANGINRDGWIVGCGLVLHDPFAHGVVLVPNPAYNSVDPYYDYIDLGRLPKAPQCVGQAVNAEGMVVGMSGQRPFCWQGQIHDIDPVVAAGAALDVNLDGDIVGWACEQAMDPVACAWSGGIRRELAGQCTITSEATAIGDDGLIVGWVETELEKIRKAVLWDGPQAIDLTDAMRPSVITMGTVVPPWVTLTEARDIDPKGRIVGFGTNEAGKIRAFLLVPCEEPTTP